tara:strand:- start:2353 stop:6015 length:3663 start_codon:yes stop_codon:yes gene_type:complete
MNEELDPTLEIDNSGGQGLSEEETAAAVENMQAAEQERAATQAQYAEQREQQIAAQTAQEGANLGDYIADTFKAPIAGVRDAVANVITTPERVIDMVSGEAEEEGYEPEWDNFLYAEDDPLETKTWWGGLIRTGTEVAGTLAATGGFGKVGSGLTFMQTLKQGAITGARFDLLDIDSQDDNVSGMLKERFPLLDTPLATQEHDGPIMKTLKNVAEGMVIGGIFDTVLTGVARNFPKNQIDEVITSRKKSVKSQQLEEAAEQMKEPGFRASKNPQLADRSQKSTTSLDTAQSISKARKSKKANLGSEEGSVGSALSNTEVTALTKGTKEARSVVEKVLRRFRSQGYIDQLRETAERQGKTLDEYMAEDLDTWKKVFEGRNTSDMTPEEFWKEINKERFERVTETKTGKKKVLYSYVTSEYADAIDMINASLFNEIRDAGVAARELADIYDIKDIDGPAQKMVEKLIAGLQIRKMASSDISQQLRQYGKMRGKTVTPKLQAEMIDKQVQESVDAFRMALDMTTEDGGDEVFKAMFEGISMAKDINTLDDLDQFMKVKMRGGEWGGDPKKTGAFLREMGTMFTHSVLSGPKTAVRAIMGTSTATFSRPMAMALGGLMKGDGATMRAGLASLNAMREAIPESFELFKRKLNSYWSGDISTMKTRYVERTKMDDQWNMYGHWAETRGDWSDKLLYRTANMVRGLNDSSLLTYSTKIMASTDDAFALIIGRARAREKAFLKAADKLPDGNFQNLDAKFFRDMEDNFNNEIFDKFGNITDKAAEFSRKEATLTQDLTGFSAKLADAFNEAPWARPFFLFARTGINGLALTAKHTPGFNFLVKEFNEIARAKPGSNLSSLHKYGIHNTQDLMTAKAIQNGRLAIGSAALSMASMAYLSGNLHGNGPTDRTQRQAWKDAGWKPRTIKIGNVWINYDAFEPYNQILALVGDIGDHQQLMGEEWAEDRLSKLAMALASTATSKSYLAGLQSFVDLFSGAPGQQQRIIASLMNNTVPLSGLRNEIGKVLTPYTRELGSDIQSSIRNRNLITENIAADPLPIKYDILTGKPIKDHNFITRMFNAVSPVNFNLDYSPGRELLFNSGYDMRTSTYSAPDGTDLSDSPKVRSMYQRAIGDQNLEAIFNKMAQEESIQISIAEMNYYRKNGMSDVEPRSFPHYKRIAKVFDKAKKQAWAKIKRDNDVQKLLIQEREAKIKNRKANKGTIEKIIDMPK